MTETQYTHQLTDNDGNEISSWGKFFAGLIIISLTLLTSMYLIAYWPDRIPEPGRKSTSLYTYKPFQVRLIDAVADTAFSNKNALSDNPLHEVNAPLVTVPANGTTLIHINTLLLILVGVAGFLGNMIHIASSFTTFVGAGKFRKSWILWYCVKPFTAAALAIAVYFVLRGGFLNMSDDSANINIYGVATISILCGLFTDRATLKLKEVFDVLFRPALKDDRPDKLNERPAP